VAGSETAVETRGKFGGRALDSIMNLDGLDHASSVRGRSVLALEALLVDAVDLFTHVKQARWNVKGPNAREMHLLFDEAAASIQDHADVLADRITTLGARADATARIVGRRSRLPEYPPALEGPNEHLRALGERLGVYTQAAQSALDAATESGDIETTDVLFDTVHRADKLTWLLFAHVDLDY